MSAHKNANMKLVAMLLIGLVAGVAVAGSLPFSFSSGSLPPGHDTVAAKVHLTDTTLGVSYAATFVRSGESRPLSVIPLAFTGNIRYSVWEWRANPTDPSTVYATMLIWGPGSVGEYFVEVGRLSTDSFTGSYPGGSISWMQGGNDGFVYFLYTP